ncbi:MAG TPA: 3-oxoacyl-ACP reductase family protein [Candidatus Kapabacteria bacterium]|nr:3-oxoacyl-ACP reductase family protein [Candidatus Kapabacteria bacterium]
MVLDLSGVRALVTGGTRGIGRAITDALAASGARVAANYRGNNDAADVFARELGERNFEHMMLRADVTQERAVGTMMKRIEESWGGLDLVVLNAGIWERGPIGTMTLAEWRETININLTGAFVVVSEAMRLLGAGDGGAPKRIIFISSTAGQRGEAFYSHYAASKGALISLTKSLAVELAPQGITVNCVAPGWVRTEMTEGALSENATRKEIVRSVPLGRVGEPEEIASAVVYLASRQASYITGEILNVNGGSVLCG